MNLPLRGGGTTCAARTGRAGDPPWPAMPVAGSGGFAVVELAIVVAIVATLAGIAVPLAQDLTARARVARAVADVRIISSEIDVFNVVQGRYPNDLGEIGRAGFRDPWGNPYRYLNIRNGNPPPGQMRKDRFLVPINSDYDLYSTGADGQTTPALTAALSRDDIVRAGDGAYFGLATGY